MAGEARAGNRFLSSRRGENSKLRKEERGGGVDKVSNIEDESFPWKRELQQI